MRGEKRGYYGPAPAKAAEGRFEASLLRLPLNHLLERHPPALHQKHNPSLARHRRMCGQTEHSGATATQPKHISLATIRSRQTGPDRRVQPVEVAGIARHEQFKRAQVG